jgi:DNA (cytosine-5)-methyltransferase 1
MTPQFEGGADAPTAVDICAGCGGLSEGLARSGFRLVGAWEKATPEYATYYYRHAKPNGFPVYRDATDIDESKIPGDLDLLAGGPHCQGFSSARGSNDSDDPRNLMPFIMVEWAKISEPRLILIENVVGMETHHKEVLTTLMDEIATVGRGYDVEYIKLNAKHYGVPQDRERLFILGIRNDISPPSQWEPNRLTNGGQQRLTDLGVSEGSPSWPEEEVAASDVLDSLPEPIPPQQPHEDSIHMTVAEQPGMDENALTRARVHPNSLGSHYEENGEVKLLPTNHVQIDHAQTTRQKLAQFELGEVGNTTTSRRLHPDEPAPTLTVSSGTPPVHYRGATPDDGANGDVDNVRRLTVRECASLQTFDTQYTFGGTRTEQYRMVCNAVPPGLAWHLGLHLRQNVLKNSLTSSQAGPQRISP